MVCCYLSDHRGSLWYRHPAYGIGKLQTAVDLLRLKNEKWWWRAISAAISVICAFVIILNPFTTTVVLWQFTGISLLVEAVFDIVTLFVNRKNNVSAEE